MKLLNFLINLVLNLKKNTSIFQFIVFIFLLLLLGIISIFTLIKVVIPFTYIAL